MSEKEIEKEIVDKGLTAPRITLEQIKGLIVEKEYHVFPGTMLTICCLTLQNGYTVTGESACVSPENFNKEIGEKVALENAVNKIWMLEGYLLKQRLAEEKALKEKYERIKTLEKWFRDYKTEFTEQKKTINY